MAGYGFETDRIFLYCLSCDHELDLGLQTYERLAAVVEHLDSVTDL